MQSEEWRPVVGFEGWYEVSDRGRVRRVRGGNGTHVGRMSKISLDAYGYPRVSMSKNSDRRMYKVHRLVAEAFLGPCPEGMGVNHKDADKTNNAPGNLEYLTPRRNLQHAKKLGLFVSGGDHWTRRNPEKLPRGDQNWTRIHRDKMPRGEDSPQAKLSSEAVLEIWRRANAGRERQRDIAAEFGVCQMTVSRIKRAKRWTHLLGNLSPRSD